MGTCEARVAIPIAQRVVCPHNFAKAFHLWTAILRHVRICRIKTTKNIMIKSPDFQKVLDQYRPQVPVQTLSRAAKFFAVGLGKGRDKECADAMQKELDLYIKQFGRVENIYMNDEAIMLTGGVPDKKPVILAGNYSQFMGWCRQTGIRPEECIYYDNPMKIVGLRNFVLIKIGTCYENENYDDLVREAEYRKRL